MVSFTVPPETREQLEWIREFVDTEVTPLDLAFGHENVVYDKSHPVQATHLRPLQKQVQARGLWSCHLTQELGGQGYGQVQLALMNEVLGRSLFAPSVFGCQAPDSGNAEILAHHGTPDQKQRFLAPLLAGEISSSYTMTEPQGGADPEVFTTRAARDGDHWVLNGEKWFASSAARAAFLVVMAVTDPDVPVHRGASMFLVPAGTEGLEHVRHTGMGFDAEEDGNHPYLRLTDVRVPAANLMGPEGAGFEIAQDRLGSGRLHHAMRTVGALNRCLEMLCERALSRRTRGRSLADNHVVQQQVAQAWVELTQFRLQVLHAAWTVDQVGGAGARKEIAGVKVATPRVYREAVLRTMQIHGALRVSNEMPLARMLLGAISLGVADGPTEAHESSLARLVLRDHEPAPDGWPTEHLPTRRDAARARFATLEED